MNEYIINPSYPQYYNTNSNLTNACANIAGANITGLTSYVNSKLQSITFTSIMNNGSLNLSTMDTQLRAGRPISLFLSGYNISTLNDNGSKVTLSENMFDANHIMIAFGYSQVNYYNSNNSLIKTHTYIYVASGQQFYTGVYVLNLNGTINDAEVAYIY